MTTGTRKAILKNCPDIISTLSNETTSWYLFCVQLVIKPLLTELIHLKTLADGTKQTRRLIRLSRLKLSGSLWEKLFSAASQTAPFLSLQHQITRGWETCFLLLSFPPTELGFIGSSPAGVIPAPTPGKLLCVVREKTVCKLLYHSSTSVIVNIWK